MPTAPVPAKTSRKREPLTRGPRTLKRVSRKRSLVGRRAVPLRDLRMRLRYLPATMRILREWVVSSGQFQGHGSTG